MPECFVGTRATCKPPSAPQHCYALACDLLWGSVVVWGEAQGEQEPEDTGFWQVAGRGREPW